MKQRIYILPILFLTLTLAALAPAQWSNDPAVNTPVATAAGDQFNPEITSLGPEGCIVVWHDGRTGNVADIYVQKFDADGYAQWTVNGVALSTAPGHQWVQQIAGDGSGGAVVAWQDERNDNVLHDIYAGRISSSGVPLWTADGVPVSIGDGHHESPTITGDDAGGAFVGWGGTNLGVQRLDASGVPQWTADGVILAAGFGMYAHRWPKIVNDDSAGAIITWQADTAGAGWDILAQRVGPTGAKLWGSSPVLVCGASGPQEKTTLIPDGAGGAIITWEDGRSGSLDIYAQRLDKNGVPQWTANGVPVCTAAGDQRASEMHHGTVRMLTSDGAGGAIITWKDSRSGEWAIYAQRIDGSGVPQWVANGVLVSAEGGQANPSIASDDSGGAVIVWESTQPVTGVDLYAQRVDASGICRWTPGGVPVSTAANMQDRPRIISTGSGEAIVAWKDLRSGSTSDTYIQKIIPVAAMPPTSPVLTSVTDVPNDQGGAVTLFWSAVYQDTAISSTPFYSVWRSITSIPEPAGSKYRTTVSGGKEYAWEWIADQPAHQFPAYSFTAPTLYDSMYGTGGIHYFLVSAHTGDTSLFFDSNVRSGYSVDNLAPIAPSNLAVSFLGNLPVLHWQANPEADIHHYSLYRSIDSLADPPPGSPYGTSRDTMFVDNNPVESAWYTIRAWDVHGNVGPAGNRVRVTLTGVDEPGAGIPTVFALGQNYPNPFNPVTRISYDLPKQSVVRVSVFTALGQEVATIVDETREPGYHSVMFDASALPNGIYFYRMTSGSFTDTKKMLLIK
jgi:hypothetical protein